MTLDQIIALIVLVAVVGLMIHGRMRSDVVALSGAAALLLLGVVRPVEVQSAFASPAVIALAGLAWVLQRPKVRQEFSWLPFVLATLILLMGFFGLAYSLYPYVIMDRMTLWDAAASTPALTVIFFGTVVTVPVILAYTAFAYWVFRGKSTPLTYG